MYDVRIYMSCCQCATVFRRDDAVRHPDLFGGFCSDRCALTCLAVNNPPRTVEQQYQANSGERMPPQVDDLISRQVFGDQYW